MTAISFLTNHARVLICIATDPGARIRDIALRTGLTERATHRIIDELVEGDYLEKHRIGGRNYYEIHAQQPLLHELEGGVPVGELVAPILKRLRARE